MELGAWGIIKEAPSLLALIPLILYIILAFNEKIKTIISLLLCIIIGAILTGQGVLEIGSVFAGALDSTLGQIVLIIALGTAVGAIMSETGVSRVLCCWIINGVGVNTQKRPLLPLKSVVWWCALC